MRTFLLLITSSCLVAPGGCTEVTAPGETEGEQDGDGDGEDDGDAGEDEGSTSEGGESGDEGVTPDCYEALRRGPLQLGEPCTDNSQCRSFFCEQYETFPPNAGGQCAELPPDCLNRSMGNLKDIVHDTPLVGATMFFGPAPEIVSAPWTATRLAQSITDENGYFDMTTTEPVDAFYAVLGASFRDDYEMTVGFLGFPIDSANHYEPAFGVHDFFAVSLSDLAAWNTALADDPEAAPHLPIEEKGGVVTVVGSYDVAEKRIAGVTVTPMDPASATVIRYLDENGTTFTSESTSSNGVVLILGAQNGELFDANSAEMKIWDPERGRPGVVQDGVYEMLILMVPR